MEQQLSGGKGSGQVCSTPQPGLRAYRVEVPAMAGTSIATLEDRFAEGRLAVQRVRRAAAVLLEPEPGLKLRQGDVVVVFARRSALLVLTIRGPVVGAVMHAIRT